MLTLATSATTSAAQEQHKLAPNAPADQPVSAADLCQWKAMVSAIKPYSERARNTYPMVKQRFLKGLPHGESFFVTAALTDSAGHHEQVFLLVDSISNFRIVGRIWNDILVVSGYRRGQHYEMPEAEIIDWLISKPDGSEEGNEVGKFLDTYQPPDPCVDRDPVTVLRSQIM